MGQIPAEAPTAVHLLLLGLAKKSRLLVLGGDCKVGSG
jgi:hypothetical protein